MTVKLLALGNTLMEDDGIAIYLAGEMEEKLNELGIEVIYGETDIDYCCSAAIGADYLFLLDAAYMNKKPGDITLIPISELETSWRKYSQHNIHLIDILKLSNDNLKGHLIAIEAEEVQFHYGLSPILFGMVKELESRVILTIQELMKSDVWSENMGQGG